MDMETERRLREIEEMVLGVPLHCAAGGDGGGGALQIAEAPTRAELLEKMKEEGFVLGRTTNPPYHLYALVEDGVSADLDCLTGLE
jgi:hypothetical protein